MTVAVVDFGAVDAPERFATSLRETGFAVINNHPIDSLLVDRLYAEWSAFFESGDAGRYLTTDFVEGYFPLSVSETAKGAATKDLKEFFHLHIGGTPPSEVSDAVVEYLRQADGVARTLLGWLEDRLPADVAARLSMPLTEMLTGSTKTLLRVLRYPPLPVDAPANAVRAAAHEDINLLTVLPASDEAGLELLGADGGWFPVPTDPGSLAINAGEMLDLATGGYFPATTHRVVNPAGAAAARPRMALPLFLHPADDVVLAGGRTASEFLQQRIAELSR